jgi:hypothetical protein
MDITNVVKRFNVMEPARPGMVASVGDALTRVRLPQSAPESETRYEPGTGMAESGSMMSRQPYVYDYNWSMGRNERTVVGLIQQDIRVADRLHEPVTAAEPRYDWYNKIGRLFESKRTGNMFLPLPGVYQLGPGEVARGGQVVRQTDMDGKEGVIRDQEMSSQMFGRSIMNYRVPKAIDDVVENRGDVMNKNVRFAAPHGAIGTSLRYK